MEEIIKYQGQEICKVAQSNKLVNFSQITNNDKPLTEQNVKLGMTLLKQLFNVSDSFILNCSARCKEMGLTNKQFYNLVKDFIFLNTGYPTLANFFNEKNKPTDVYKELGL